MDTHDPQDYDIVIIGAGIQGAGVAQAAAICGYKTLVIERLAQAGMATSSKSSKLIHGGLRYLESAQFRLVRECLEERKRLLENAPQLVQLTPFYIPVYQHTQRPAWLIYLGLFIYSLLSFKPFKRIDKSSWPKLDGLSTQGLKAVFMYYDAQTDDQKLTRAVAASAMEHGARFEYSAEFQHSDYKHSQHQLSYRQNQQVIPVNCRYLINCTGPWLPQVQQKIYPQMPVPDIKLIAGTHIIIDRPLNCGAYYIEASDKRAIFVLPWNQKQTLIGTTEKEHLQSADSVKPTDNEIDYLLNTYNEYFSGSLTAQDVYHAFAGLRVLPAAQSSSFHASRDSIIVSSKNHPGQIALVGGKLTAYRASAEQVINLVNRWHDKKPAKPARCTRHLSIKPV